MTDAQLNAALAPLYEEFRRMRDAFEQQGRMFDLLRNAFRDTPLSKKEAAVYCKCGTRTIDRKVEAGLLNALPGATRRFTVSELDRALQAGVF
jgi:hypothetical protein